MKTKAVTATVLAISLTLSGCAGVIEGEYATSTAHTVNVSWDDRDAETATVSDINELYDAINSLVERGLEQGVIRFESYTGDMESDLDAVSMAVSSETPIGAYAVYYIDFSLNRIVSFFEADVTVVYKRSVRDLTAMDAVSDFDELRDILLQAIRSGTTRLALLCDGTTGALDGDDVSDALNTLYYEYPGEIIYYPDCTVNRYPEDGASCVLEITMSSPYSAATLEQRRQDLIEAADGIIDGIDGGTDEEKLRYIADTLSELVYYDREMEATEAYSRWYNALNAYGALVLHRAVGEGFAMAVKLLCDSLDIPCFVVQGRMNNVSHSWNIVTIDGCNYHMDVSTYRLEAPEDEPEGDTDGESGEPDGDVTDGTDGEPADEGAETLFFSDRQMEKDYWWDSQSAPDCPLEFGSEPDGETDGEQDGTGATGTAGNSGHGSGEEPSSPNEPSAVDEPSGPEDPGDGNTDTPDGNADGSGGAGDEPDNPGISGDPTGADTPESPGDAEDPDGEEDPDSETSGETEPDGEEPGEETENG